MTIRDWKNFHDNQLKNWELAFLNYERLEAAKRKKFSIGDLDGYVLCNSSRSASTLAKTDTASIKKRKCFLCSINRPLEQLSYPLMTGWSLLINPFPILPYHFTIVSNNHYPQKFEKETADKAALILEGMVIFFNDEGAGASAPDHCHYQSVPMTEVPLIKLLEKEWDRKETLKLPFQIYFDIKEILSSVFPLNIYVWQSGGEIRRIGIPRKAHRPDMFYKDPPERRAISPGALDMGGILVTPYEEDFELINDEEISLIYKQVGLQ